MQWVWHSLCDAGGAFTTQEVQTHFGEAFQVHNVWILQCRSKYSLTKSFGRIWRFSHAKILMYVQFLPRFLTLWSPGPAFGLGHTDGLCLSVTVLHCYCEVADGDNFVVPCISFNFISFVCTSFHPHHPAEKEQVTWIPGTLTLSMFYLQMCCSKLIITQVFRVF